MVADWFEGLSCDRCKKIWEMYDKEPPCYECEPEIHDSNVDAIKVYSLVKNQHIIDFGRPVDINLPSVEFALNLYRIKKPEECFEKVYMLYQRRLTKILEDAEQTS